MTETNPHSPIPAPRPYVELGRQKLYLNDHGSVIGPHGVTITSEGLIALGLEVKLEIQVRANRFGGRTISQEEFNIAKGHFRSTWNKTGHGGVTARTKAGLTAALSSLGIWVEA